MKVTESPKKRTIWFKDVLSFTLIMVGFLVFSIIIYVTYKSGQKEKETFLKEIAPKEIKKIGDLPQLALEYTRDYLENDKRYVEGKIKNITQQPIEYVYVNLEWYDAQGKFLRVVTSDAYVVNLLPGAEYNFKIGCPNQKEMAKFVIDLQTKFAESIPFVDQRKK